MKGPCRGKKSYFIILIKVKHLAKIYFGIWKDVQSKREYDKVQKTNHTLHDNIMS